MSTNTDTGPNPTLQLLTPIDENVNQAQTGALPSAEGPPTLDGQPAALDLKAVGALILEASDKLGQASVLLEPKNMGGGRRKYNKSKRKVGGRKSRASKKKRPTRK